MSAVGRLTLLYFTLLPLQRVLTPAGAALLVLGGLLLLLRLPAQAQAVLAFGGLLVFFPMITTAGAVFATLVAARSRALWPGFRVRLLAATGAVVLLSVMLVGIFVRSTSELTSLEAFVYTGIVFSAMLWFMALASGGAFRLACFLGLVVLAGRGLLEWVWPGGEPARTVAVALALSGGWAIFGAWCLRPMGARRPRPVRQTERDGFSSRDRASAPRSWLEIASSWSRDFPKAPSAREAAITYLWQAHDPAWRGWLKSFGFLAFVSVLILIAGGVSRGFLAAPFVAVPAAFFPAVRETVRRARLLWLKLAMSRVDLLRTIEAALLERELPHVLIMAATLLAVPAILLDVTVGGIAAILLCAGTASVLGAYLALMSVRQPDVWDVVVGVAYLLGLAVAGISALLDPIRAPVLVGISAVQVAAAFACRAIALRRWQALDWLELGLERKPLGARGATLARGWGP